MIPVSLEKSWEFLLGQVIAVLGLAYALCPPLNSASVRHEDDRCSEFFAGSHFRRRILTRLGDCYTGRSCIYWLLSEGGKRYLVLAEGVVREEQARLIPAVAQVRSQRGGSQRAFGRDESAPEQIDTVQESGLKLGAFLQKRGHYAPFTPIV